MNMDAVTVLVIEDGDEYLENLTRFVPGPSYLQAHCGQDAVTILRNNPVDIIYLDMRFDRIPETDLLGDRDAAIREHNGDAARGLKYLMNNQGLFILAALKREGFGSLPVVVAYDFSKEPRRFENLRRTYPSLEWVSDAVSFEEVVSLFGSIVGEKA